MICLLSDVIFSCYLIWLRKVFACNDFLYFRFFVFPIVCLEMQLIFLFG